MSANQGELNQAREQLQKVQASEIAAFLHREVLDILETTRKTEHRLVYEDSKVVSSEKLLEAVRYALRDLDRLEVDQRREPSLTKFVGYLGFWFGKLKPLLRVDVLPPGDGDSASEILDVNEKMVFPLLRRLIMRVTTHEADAIPNLWKLCNNAQCAKAGDSKPGKCFFRKIDAYLIAADGRFHEYIFYTLRYRPASPYLLVALLDQAIYFSCEKTCPPLFTQPLASAV